MMFDDRVILSELPAGELYQMGDELAAYIRHPAVKLKRQQAGERLADVIDESERRWQAVWHHADNHGVNNNLEHIYRIFA